MNITLLYGLQSSGGSYVAWCMADDPEVILIPDLLRMRGMQTDTFTHDAIIKVTVSPWIMLEDLIENMQPDRVVLVLRNEFAVRNSLLRRHGAATWPRSYLRRGEEEIDGKIAIMQNTITKRHLWDEAVRYEEFADGKRMPARDIEEVILHNWAVCPWARDNARPQKWGIGGIRVPGKSSRWHDRRLRWLVRHGDECPEADGVAVTSSEGFPANSG